jgi:hypothetical protein
MRATLLGIAVALSMLAGAVSSAQADSALVGYWKLNEGAGTVAADSSGRGNTGTLTGSTTWVAGAFGGALGFDGSSGYVRIPDSASLEPAAQVAVAAWIRNAGSPGDFKYVVAKGAAGCVAASYGLYTGPGGGLEFYVSRNHGSVFARSPDAGAGMWDGKWHLAVGTFDGSAIRLYVDGVQVASGTNYPGALEYPLSSSNDLFIGDYPGCPTEAYAFKGDIEDVTVWNQALSADTIGLMAQGNQTPPVSTGSSSQAQSSGSSGSSRGGAGSTRPVGSAGRAPALRALRISPARVVLGTGQKTASLISYRDSQAARSIFRVLLREPGSPHGGRCVAAAARHDAKLARSCVVYVLMGTFSHTDRAGLNRFDLPAKVGGRRLKPAQYLLQATPREHGVTGKTLSAAFRVVA